MDSTIEEERLLLARSIMAILDDWGVGAEDRIRLLGLPEGTRTRHLERFRLNTPLPEEGEVMARVEHLVGIADALRTTFPRNPNMGPHWLRTPHRRFAKKPPLAVMIEDGLSGLVAIRSELDCSWAWDRSGS